LYRPIELKIDMDARKAHLVVPGLLESSGEPVRNPVTGAELRARINLPHGFEYRIAEVASGRTKATGKIDLDLSNSHAHFADIRLNQKGVVEQPSA
jgi:hypothetical protein